MTAATRTALERVNRILADAGWGVGRSPSPAYDLVVESLDVPGPGEYDVILLRADGTGPAKPLGRARLTVRSVAGTLTA